MAVAFSLATLIAQALSSQTNTTPRLQRAARFRLSWNAPWLAAPSPKKATAMSSRPIFLKASAWPTAVGIPSPTIPLQPKAGSFEKRCMWPPLPWPSPVSLPKISAAILFMSTPCASAW